MQRYPMTPEGKLALEKELHQLKTVDRPRITAAIAEAREHGDLKENAEYHAAREQQGFCEGRIQDIEGKLGACQVIDVKDLEQNGRVVFGVRQLDSLSRHTRICAFYAGKRQSMEMHLNV